MKPYLQGVLIGVVLYACWLGGALTNRHFAQKQLAGEIAIREDVIAARGEALDSAVDYIARQQAYMGMQAAKIQQLEAYLRWMDNQRLASL